MVTPIPDQTPHEYIDAEISVAGMKTPADEKTLESALKGRDGMITLRISEGNVAVEYDPIRITKSQIGRIITEAGFQVTDVETGRASPVSDALHEWGPED